VQLYLQDQLVEKQPTGREIVGWMQIKPTENGSGFKLSSDLKLSSELKVASGVKPTAGSNPIAGLNPTLVSKPSLSSELNPSKLILASAPKVSAASRTSQASKTLPASKVSSDSKIEATLPQISMITILHHFNADENESLKGLSLEKLANKFVVKSDHKRNAGLFITLIKDGDTRACWGSVNSSQRNLVQAAVYTTEDALTKDYRYSKIKKSEINQLIPQVTVVKKIIPINSIVSMQPLKQGLMVRAGGKGAVLLPGEASDPHYQLVKTKLKAGIPMSQPCQLYRIEADVYR